MKWGNIKISKKNVGADGKILLEGALDLEDKDMKKTKKITWVTIDKNTNVEINLVELGHLIPNPKIMSKYNCKDPKHKRD